MAAVVIGTAVSGALGCRPASTETAEPRVVRLAIGSRDASGSFVERLAKEYEGLDVGFRIQLLESVPDPIGALERGEADITIAGADVLYSSLLTTQNLNSSPASAKGQTSTTPLRAIAVLDIATVHLLVPKDSTIYSVADLRGRRVGLSSLVSSFRPDPLLTELGVAGVERYSAPAPSRVADWRTELNVDALWILSFAPRTRVADMVSAGARLVPIDGDTVERLRKHYPFIRPTIIPAGTYPGQDTAVHTLGSESLYVCRSDLREPLVHDLTKYLFEVLPRIAVDYPNFRRLDVIHASATPIPLHGGAARYYREVELFRNPS